MYDIEKIIKIIKEIKDYERELEEMGVNSLKDLDEPKTIHATSMLCFAILNRVIDLGQEILIKEEAGFPSRYADIFYNLAKIGFMDKKEAEELKQLIDFRNIIAHAYFELGKKDILKMVEGIFIIDKFIEKIKKRVKK